MSPQRFKQLFPNASQSVIEANCGGLLAAEARAGIQNTQSSKRKDALARASKGETQSAGCPVVSFTLRRVHLLDVDAKYASIKDLLDGLQYAQIIRGDREGQVHLEVRQERVRRYADERTIIEIYE